MRSAVNHVVAFSLPPDVSAVSAVLLPKSLRRFGGQLADCDLWAFVQDAQGLPGVVLDALAALQVQVIPFQPPADAASFPFGAKVYAAAQAEARAESAARVLVWLDHDTLVVKEPEAFLLGKRVELGCCPVHHTLVGSRFDQPLDAFWDQVYRHCEVSPGAAYPMLTVVDAEKLRPYYNAGLLVVSPALGLLRRWWDAFGRYYRHPVYRPFYQANYLYQVFIHQAFLSGMVLKYLSRSEIQEFPQSYNYPLHLHGDFQAGKGAAGLDELVTCRFESIFDRPGWQEAVPGWGQEQWGSVGRWLESQVPSSD